MRGYEPFVALTDRRWFDFLTSRSEGGRVDEVNFWSPKSVRPIRRFRPGTPVFLRLKRPWYSIAGYGFFAHHTVLGLGEAWETFAWRNGDESEAGFLRRIGEYRGVDLLDLARRDDRLGCTILRDVRLWPPERWIPWGDEMGWKPNTQQGATERDPKRAAILLGAITEDRLRTETAAEYEEAFELLEWDERSYRDARLAVREGQGTFRTRLLDAYGRRCAITGEKTEPVLDAAHIQPYLGPRSNHVQNGLVLTKEFHALFDESLVTVTPELRVRVSPVLRERWQNGRRYYDYDGRPLARIPEDRRAGPSEAALLWHNERFERRARSRS